MRELRPIDFPPLARNPLVSVLVTCYNYGRYVTECIESVAAQTYPRFELIVSDDASTDDSVQQVRASAAKDHRIVLITGEHSGMAGALNRAWPHCRGEIICLLDADDTFDRDKLETVVAAFAAHPRVGYVIHRAHRTDMHGKRSGVLPLLKAGPAGWCADRTLASGGVLPDVPPTSNLSFRTEVLQRIFPLPEVLHGYGEVILQRVVPLLTEVHSLDRALATWRFHGANDANSAKLTDSQIERELGVMEVLWGIQRQYLERLAPHSADALQPLSRSEYYCRMQYLLALRKSSADSSLWRRRLLECPAFQERPMLDRCIWRIAAGMPSGPMNRLLDLTLTQNRVKEWIARLWKIGN